MLNRTSASLLLVLATILWGFAFVAQKNAMAYMGPLTYMGSRYVLGGLIILPIAIWQFRRSTYAFKTADWLLLAAVSANFFLGSWLQQAGLLATTVTNAGFLTGLYVFFVPIFLLFVFRTAPHPVIWLCAPLAFAGIFLLNGASFARINSGDLLVIASSAFWGMHVLLLGYIARRTGTPVFVSSVSFLAAGIAGYLGAFILEAPTIEAISLGWVEIAYAGICSTAIAFTLQAIAQMHIPPANAAIILSGEALFAALGGAVVLGERLPPVSYLGALCIFTAMVLVETVPLLKRPKTSATA